MSHKQIIQEEWSYKVASDQAAHVALLGSQTFYQSDLGKIVKALHETKFLKKQMKMNLGSKLESTH